ncbi:MAG: CotH kinase family protein, partial [Longimicrobiales bacterium]
MNLPIPDRDGDGIADDGDFSGLVGDAFCSGGTALCDDNCPFELNPTQANAGGSSSGDACECGDADDDGTVTSADWDEVREFLVGLIPAVAAPQKCAVTTPALCDLRAAVGMERASAGLPPPIQPVCDAAAAPADPSDLLFDPDRVLDVVITMAPADWDTLRFEARDVYDTLGPGCFDGPPVSPYTEFPANATIDGETFANVSIRKKGFYGSADQFKPSLKIDSNDLVGGQLIAGLEHLTFNNARQDPSLVKQCLGYALFEAAGLPASRCNFANVTVNGLNLGVYVHVEEIEEQPYLGRYFANTTGNIYEGTLSDFRTTFVNTFERKNNEENPSQADLAAIVAAAIVPDGQPMPALGALVNMDAFHTYWAMEGLIGHWDGYQSNRNNFWIYFDPNNGGRANFLPWGIDALFAGGNPLAGNLSGNAPVVFPRAMLTRKLYLEPTSRAIFLGRVQTLLNTVWNEAALLAEINRMEALLEPYSGPLDAQLNLVRNWINGRRAEVQTQIGGGGPAWTAPLDPPACLALAGT